ncbi:unnamed protein product [Diamesa serratosioi]
MNSFVVFAVLALAAVANCELPSGYNYNRPQQQQQQQSFGGGNSYQSNGGGGGGGGGYQQESIGQNTNEGSNVDPQLLEQIKQILLKEESNSGNGNGGNGGFGGNGGGQLSSQYGAPQQQYGPPAQISRIVGIELENALQAIQVAQYSQRGGSSGGSAGGYSRGPSSGGFAPSVNAPSSNYGAPAQRPSSNYGAPF